MAGLIKPTQRFSLLLLDEGEYYFEDFAGFYYPGGMDDDQAVKSLIFEPDELSKPIMKLPFRHVESVDRYYGPLLALLQNKVDMFSLKSRVWVEMKENNNNAPYLFKEEKREHRFSLTYVNLTNFLPRVINFYNIALRGDVSMASETDSELVKLMEERENSILFDRSHIEDLNEKILLESTRVTPLVNNPGRLLITNKIIYFMPFNNVSIKPVEKIRLEHIIRIEKRRYVLRDVGLEIFAQQEVAESMFFSFKNTDLRDSVHNTLIVQPDSEDQSLVTLKWQNGLISNYDYLMYLNTLAGRSFNDITQYPVFPWVVADYKSESLDLKNPSTFRELSKPIGALNADRLSMFKQRMRDIPSDHPKFLYGTHYSTPGYVLFYLVRSAPEYMLRLQNGKYDSASRLFHSISETWQGVLNNQADVKELIPEFYDVDRKGGFLINSEHLNFGVKDNGEVVDNVVLPPWAKDSEDFVKQLRNALESDYIGDKLHQWIDLIFGYKQRGQEAVKSDNLFYYLTYEGAVDLDNIRDPHERRAIIAQIKEFGQTPKQLMKTPHPPKLPKSERVSNVSQLITPNEPKTVATQSNVGWNLDEVTSLESEFSFKLHKDIITSMALSRDNKTLFSVSQDASLKIYSLPEKRQMRSVNLCELALSSLKLTPDEKTVIVGSWDNNVYLYSIDYGRVLDTIAAHDDSVSCVCYNPLKPDLLVSSSWDASVKMWRISGTNVNKLPIGEFVDHDAEVHCIDIDSSATTAVAGSVDGTVFFYDLVSKSAIRSVELHTDVVTCVQFTPEGNRAVTCSSDGYVKIVDISGSQVFSMNLGCPLKALKTDGQVILVGGEDGILSIIDIKSNAIVKQIKGQEGITSIVCSSSCDLVVVGCSGGSIRVLVTRKSGSNSN